MKFKRSIVEQTNVGDLIKQVIMSQSTLRGIIEKNECSSVERHSEITTKLHENTLILENVLVRMNDLQSEIDEMNKPWYKKLTCL